MRKRSLRGEGSSREWELKSEYMLGSATRAHNSSQQATGQRFARLGSQRKQSQLSIKEILCHANGAGQGPDARCQVLPYCFKVVSRTDLAMLDSLHRGQSHPPPATRAECSQFSKYLPVRQSGLALGQESW